VEFPIYPQEKYMKRFLLIVIFFQTFFAVEAAIADPEYTRIELEIDIERCASDLWAMVGGYCAISEWANIDCEITSGDGDMGTVRVLAGGRIIEILVARTALSYGYTQPVQDGQFYNLYHGFMEAKPMGDNRSKLLYTLVYDLADLPDQAAKDADIARRRGMFESALKNMKGLAEKE
jgi:hypothetical protein